MLCNYLNPETNISAAIIEVVNGAVMPCGGFQYLTDITPMSGHRILFIGADEEGLKLTRTFSYLCDDEDCDDGIDKSLPAVDSRIADLIEDELIKEQESEENSLREETFDEVLNQLPEVLDRIEESVSGKDHLGKIYLCNRNRVGWVNWRLFIPFVATTTTYPYMLEGIILDTDGETHPAKFSILELSEPIRHLCESEIRRIDRLMKTSYRKV